MIDTWTENNKLYTKREHLKNWEFNAKLLSDERFNALRRDREELLDIGTLLVMPEENHLLVLGGNQRNQVDGLIGRDKEAIELVDFKQLDDGRWYVVSDLVQDPSGQFVGEVRTDLRSFATKFSAMKTYSYKHNSQYAGYNPDDVASDMGNPELQEIDWSTIFANVGDPKSLQDYANLVAPAAIQELQETQVDPEPQTEQTEQQDTTPETEQNTVTGVDKFEARLTECPDCGCVFEANKYPAQSESITNAF